MCTFCIPKEEIDITLRFVPLTKPTMKSIQTMIHSTILLIHIILTGGAVGFTPSTTQSIRSPQTTVLNEVTNDNAERQLRVIDLPTELAAFEYVNDHDYAAYDIFEDADRYAILYFV